jgi:transcriptional regulator
VCRHLKVEMTDVQQRRRDSLLRPIIARMLSRHGGLTQRDIASWMKVSTGKAVSAQLQRLTSALMKNRELSRLVNRIDAELQSVRTAVKY